MHLSGITLLSVDTSVSRQKTIEVLKFCDNLIKFDKIVFITNEDTNDVNFNCDVRVTEKIKNSGDYNRFMITDLNNYVETDYVLIVQYDGFILNPRNWLDDYLNYDYIGAPWPYRQPPHYHPLYPYKVGNGGFSLRSKKLLTILSDIKVLPSGTWPEDAIICNTSKDSKPYPDGRYLTEILREEKQVKFAPFELASEFSVENGTWDGQFGFHGKDTDISKTHKIFNKFPYKR